MRKSTVGLKSVWFIDGSATVRTAVVLKHQKLIILTVEHLRKYKHRKIRTAMKRHIILYRRKATERQISEREKKHRENLYLWFTSGYVTYKCCTLKQVGHIVMLTSGSRERKYSHLSGLGQRLIRTSLLLMERSTKRLTLTGTKFEPPCCLDTQMNTSTFHYGPRTFHLLQLVSQLGEY